jgi:signal transduction histidine kinase
MTFLSKALDGLGRWYVALPPVLIIALLAALFFITGAGQARLEEAGDRLQNSATREHSVDELQNALSAAVAAQRGYLLTGNADFLGRYDTARASVVPRLDALRRAVEGTPADDSRVRNLQVLIGKRLEDLSLQVSVQQQQGAAAALALVQTRLGTDAGIAILDLLDTMRGQEGVEHVNATRHWAGSLSLSRWIALIGTVLSILLVGIASRVVFSEMRRQTVLTEQLRDQKQHLEREVEQRTQELIALSTHLQRVAEREKANLARELHDELGGLLVGARMDLSWAEQRLAAADPDLRLRLGRVQQNLAAGIDLKRRLIEELRPTLLDNVGLFAALRWQLKETCGNAGIQCIESFPAEEPRFAAEAAIALFRIAQEAFSNVIKHAAAKTVNVSLELAADQLLLRIADDGCGIAPERITASTSHGIASMRHRARALRGQLDLRAPAEGGTVLVVRVPIANALQPAE